MRRLVLSAIALGLAAAASVPALASPTAHHTGRIFCPIFPDPTVQTVAHAVCTHTPH